MIRQPALTDEEFEQAVQDALDSLPEGIASRLTNVAAARRQGSSFSAACSASSTPAAACSGSSSTGSYIRARSR